MCVLYTSIGFSGVAIALECPAVSLIGSVDILPFGPTWAAFSMCLSSLEVVLKLFAEAREKCSRGFFGITG